MEASEVHSALMASISPEREQRRRAEAYLSSLDGAPGFGVLLLQMQQQPQTERVVQIAAAVYLKNLIKRSWGRISEADQASIKSLIVKVVCVPGSLAEVQQQFCAALSLISATDFPGKWPDLLPELIAQLQSTDLGVLRGVLATMDSILERFRDVEKSDALFAELKYVLDNLCFPLTALFHRLDAHFSTEQPVLEALRLVARIFFSLNWQDLPEFFEDNMSQWMPLFEKYLGLVKERRQDDCDEGEDGPLDLLQAAIVENVSLYASKYDEEFGPYLAQFATAIWHLLTSSPHVGDRLAVTAIKFLSGVVGNAVHSKNFGDRATLEQITSAIVVPNLRLRQSDLELFEDDPVEYVARHLEDADSETRRRAARDLVAAMCKQHDKLATELCLDRATRLLNEYAAGPPSETWLAKDVAIHLVVAVAARAESRARGVTKVSPDVSVADFYRGHIRPELETPPAPAAGGGDASPHHHHHHHHHKHPVVVADCLQFATTFRNQLDGEALAALVPTLAAHCRSRVRVVHTYAAACLDRLLATGRLGPVGDGAALLQPHLEPLFEALFAILDHAEGAAPPPSASPPPPPPPPPSSSSGTAGGADVAPNKQQQQRERPAATTTEAWEDEYAMKAVMRLLVVASGGSPPITPHAAEIVTDKLTKALGRVCANPRNPKFNHYLFESLAVLVRAVCSTSRANSEKFEQLLFPPFQSVLQMDVVEFAPYVFQILALLLTFRGELSSAYLGLLGPVTNAVLWERRGNVPALAQLLEAYLKVGAATVVERGQLEPILGVFQKLLASKQFELYAFGLITAVVANVDPQAYVDKYLATIFQLLLTRLQMQRDRIAYVHHLVAFCSLLAALHGPAVLATALDRAQPGMLKQLVQHVFAPTLLSAPTFNAAPDAKTAAIGLTRILCELPDAIHDPHTTPADGAAAASGSSHSAAAGAAAPGTNQAASSPWVTLLAAVLAVVRANQPALDSQAVADKAAAKEKQQQQQQQSGGQAAGHALDDELHFEETPFGYDAAFSQLHFGTHSDSADRFPNVTDLQAYVTSNVNQLCLKQPQPFQHLAQLASTITTHSAGGPGQRTPAP